MKNRSIKILKSKNLNLKSKLKEKIIILKNSEWKYGLKSHRRWLRMYLQDQDLHFLLLEKNILIGYNLLRRREYKIEKKLKGSYFYFDTFIIDKNYRNSGFAKLFISKINNFILKQKKFSLLICQKKHVNFYKKFKWKIANKTNFKMIDKSTSLKIMVFNLKVNKKDRFSIKVF